MLVSGGRILRFFGGPAEGGGESPPRPPRWAMRAAGRRSNRLRIIRTEHMLSNFLSDIDARRFMPHRLHVFHVAARVNAGIALRAAFAAQLQHARAEPS